MTATVIYVNISATGSSNGTSWADAYTSFQSALDVAVSGDQIWVAKGTYKPSYDYGLGGGSRYYHFRMIEDVEIYGGFAGTETDVDERENFGIGEDNETILSGDLNGDDVGFANNSENCYHVIYNNSIDDITLNGFTITGGNANGSGDYAKGGGMFNLNLQSPVLTNVNFAANSAIDGGGLYNKNGHSLKPTNCIFSGNQASNGGGMYIYETLINNSAFEHLIFKSNTATKNGGGIVHIGIADIYLNRCIFSGNQANNGGAYYDSTASWHMINCQNSLFSGNRANNDGGGIFSERIIVEIVNCTMSGNHAVNKGGGIYSNGVNSCSHIIANSILWKNTANEGEQLYSINDVFSGASTATWYLYNNVMQGGTAAIGLESGVSLCGVFENVIDQDPLFVEDVSLPAPTTSGDFHLISDYPDNSSPCYEQGDYDFIFPAPIRDLDLDNEKRVQIAKVDLGAYEGGNGPPPLTYVDTAAVGNNDGTSWENAFTGLSWALLCTNAGSIDTIKVAQGTYLPYYKNGGSTNRHKCFTMVNGVTLLGGYPTGGGVRDWQVYETILTGDYLGNDDGWTGGEEDFYHVVRNDSNNIDSTAVLDGFIITKGNANSDDLLIDRCGSGILNNYCSPTIINCKVTGIYNKSSYSVGMYNCHSSSSIINCTFSDNVSGSKICGIGICLENSNCSIIDCVFDSNRDYNAYSWNDGGGIAVVESNATISGCTFLNNSAARGGAIRVCRYSKKVCINDCVFIGNIAESAGGAIFADNSETYVTNCIFIGNKGYSGGAFYCRIQWLNVSNCTFYDNYPNVLHLPYSNTVTFCNSILWENGASQVYVENGHNTLNFYNCDVQHGYSTITGGSFSGDYENNINIKPLFIDTANADFRVFGNSPVINSGLNSANNSPTDIRGEARIQNTTIDMGAYEWTSGLDPDFRIHYVDKSASGNNNGQSWSDAFTSLQTALDSTFPGDNIWVAKGTYTPDSAYDLTNTSRYYHFRLINDVAIYGGFAGTETEISQRTDFGMGGANETILSGDIGTIGITDDNCYHVIYLPQGLGLDYDAILDGFTISGGNADGTAPHNKGGGIYINLESISLKNITISSNHSTYQGAGAYFLVSGSSFTNVLFSSNTSLVYGGGAYFNSCIPYMNNVEFTSNTATNGGGMYMCSCPDAFINNISFTNNACGSSNDPSVNSDGGGLSVFNTDMNISNALFCDNESVNSGAAIYLYSDSETYDAVLNNVSIASNTTANGGGIRFDSESASSTLTMNNCIVWGNTAYVNGNELSLSGPGTTTMNYSCFGNDEDDIDVVSGTFIQTNNNINDDPTFADAGDSDFRIIGNSPCMNTGNNSYDTLSTDIRGETRIQYTNIDMGAYEWTRRTDPMSVIYVNCNAGGLNTGQSWDNAFTSLQTALDAAVVGNQIWVAKGTYKPESAYDLTNTSRYYHFRMIDEIEIYGGFAGTESDISQRTNYGVGEANECILSGDLNGDDIVSGSGESLAITNNSENCYHVIYNPDALTSLSVLNGFSIKGGIAMGRTPTTGVAVFLIPELLHHWKTSHF